MLDANILCKCILLLYREGLLPNNEANASISIINNLIEINKKAPTKNITGKEIMFNTDFTKLIVDYINNPKIYSKKGLIDTLSLIFKDKTTLFQILKSQIEEELEEKDLIKENNRLRSELLKYNKELSIKDILKNLYHTSLKEDYGDGSLRNKVMENITNLELLCGDDVSDNDPSILSETDITSNHSLLEAVNKVKDQHIGTEVLKTGWKEMNGMLQGGFRRREMWVITALQHSYKSGMLQSLFAQLCRNNVPKLDDPKKKACIIYISFEDSVSVYTEFLYRFLYFNKHKKVADVDNVDTEVMRDFIQEEMTITGYVPIAINVNPMAWTYMSLFAKIESYIQKGYEVHAVILDYLSKLPTTGCTTSGPSGENILELYQRCRSYFNSKNILCITAHQLSTDAKRLARNGIDSFEFAKQVGGKGYTEGCNRVDQIVDGEMTMNIAVKNKGTSNMKFFLCIYRAKHRLPSIIPEQKKFIILEFPQEAPIPENINGDGDTKEDEFSDLFV